MRRRPRGVAPWSCCLLVEVPTTIIISALCLLLSSLQPAAAVLALWRGFEDASLGPGLTIFRDWEPATGLYATIDYSAAAARTGAYGVALNVTAKQGESWTVMLEARDGLRLGV